MQHHLPNMGVSTDPYLLHLIKIHKNADCIPGRPTVSGPGSFTENTNRPVDTHPLETTFTYCKFGKHSCPGKCIGFAVDVKSLYSSVPHTIGIETLKTFLKKPKIKGNTNTLFSIYKNALGHKECNYQKNIFYN